MPSPYWADDSVTLYHGDMREVVPPLGITPDCVVADPPYGETEQAWDRWPEGWPDVVAAVTNSMWCFGSLRMFIDRRDQFARWKLSHDGVMRKRNGTSFQADRLIKVHELFAHWYRGKWADVHHEPQRVHVGVQRRGRQKQGRAAGDHIRGSGRAGDYNGVWEDDGTRLIQSVIDVHNMRMRGIHPNEKPLAVLDPLVRYACPPGGLVLDPFAGSGSTAEASRLAGRRAVLVEADERHCEDIARRLSQDVLPLEVS